MTRKYNNFSKEEKEKLFVNRIPYEIDRYLTILGYPSYFIDFIFLNYHTTRLKHYRLDPIHKLHPDNREHMRYAYKLIDLYYEKDKRKFNREIQKRFI